MPDMFFDVDTALSEVPVNLMPLIDDTDFKTRETAVAYNAAGMDLVWNFVTSAGSFTQTAVTPTTGGNYDWTHQGDGIYTIEIPASGGASINNDTEGYGWFSGVATGVLPWRGPVIGFRAAAINDALCDGGDLLDVSVTQWNGTAVATPTVAGVPEVDITHIGGAALSTTTAQLGVNVVQVSGDATAADNLENAFDDTAGAVPWAGIVDQGTAQSATGTTIVLRAAAGFANDELVGATVVITGGTGIGQSRVITGYVGATDTATVDAWSTTPSGTITYKIYGSAPQAASATPPTAAAIADAVWDESTAGHTTAGTFGEQLKTDVDAILADTDVIGATGAGLTSLASAANLATLTGYVDTEMAAVLAAVDTEVAAIKAKTDSLTFTSAGLVDANVQQINDVTITGNGQTGTEFGV